MQLELQRKVRIFLSSPAWTEFEDVHVQDLYYKLIIAQGISRTENVRGTSLNGTMEWNIGLGLSASLLAGRTARSDCTQQSLLAQLLLMIQSDWTQVFHFIFIDQALQKFDPKCGPPQPSLFSYLILQGLRVAQAAVTERWL